MLALAVVVALASCGTGDDLQREAATGIATRGVTPTTRAGSGDVFVEAYDLAGLAGRTVHHVEPILWTALTGEANAAAHADARSISDEARRHEMSLALSLAVVRGATKTDLRLPTSFAGEASFADPDVRTAYITEVEWLAGTLRPAELALAVEIETYYLDRNDDYANFVSLARRAYDTVKRVSPGTLVYVYFQYEELIRSFPGGEATMVANLDAMIEPYGDKLDLIGLSTYPGLVGSLFPDVASLPSDYYTRIASIADRPVFFAEVGYPAEASAYIDSSEAQQAAFVRRFLDLSGPLPLRARLWSFLHDPDLTPASGLGPVERAFFGSSGLRRRDGSPKPAWDAWLQE